MPNMLRTATPMGDWRSFRATTASAITGAKDAIAAGGSYLYRIGNTVGAALESAAIGADYVLVYHAEKIMVPKMVGAGQGFTGPGVRVWWDPMTRLATVNKADPYYLIGISTEPAANDDQFVEIDLDGAAAILAADLT